MKGIDIARKMIGFHENKDTKRLNSFLLDQVPLWKGLSVNSTPWCAAFVNACEKEVGNKGTGMLNARSFLKYGKAIKMEDIAVGDIVIFERGGSTWQGHVAYVEGVDRGRDGSLLIRTVGGNQSDSVSVGWYPISRLLGIRRS